MSNDPLMSKLKLLREQAQHLNAVSDVAANALEDVEEYLVQSNIGIEADVPLVDGTVLHFDKRSSAGYRLWIEYHDEDGASQFLTWRECTRKSKIVAAGGLQELTDRLLQKMSEELEIEPDALKQLGKLNFGGKSNAK